MNCNYTRYFVIFLFTSFSLLTTGLIELAMFMKRYIITTIRIKYMNTTNNNIYYVFDFMDNFSCIKSINSSLICTTDMKCPYLTKNSICTYYCDCDLNKCSFSKLYNIYTTYPFICIITSISILLVMIITRLFMKKYNIIL